MRPWPLRDRARGHGRIPAAGRPRARVRRRAALAWAAAALLPGPAASQPLPGAAAAEATAAASTMPVPPVGASATLRLAYFHNPAFPDPPAGFADAVLRRSQAWCLDHLRIDVGYVGGDRLAIADAFQGLPAEARDQLPRQVHGFGGTRGERWRLVEPLKRHLAATRRSFASLLDEARPHLLTPEPGDLDELAEALVDSQLLRLARWQPLFGDDLYHLFPAWLAAAAASRWPWEVVLTNGLVASAEYEAMELWHLLRAGVTNGITTQSPSSAHGLVSVLTLYPFTGNDPTLLALRDGRAGGGDDAVEWAAALLVHELGHQLMHLAHPASPACVMRPPQTLRFHEWVAGLDASRCRLGSVREMVPGAVKFQEIRKPFPLAR